MVRKRYCAAIVAVVSSALVLAGCSQSSQQEASSDSAGGVEIKLSGDYNPLERDQIKDGGELTLPIGEVTEQSNASHGNAVVDTNPLWY